jgi:site-specific DNA-methyltransferase (adenine-specific)
VDDLKQITLENKVDLVLTDPPYGVSIVKESKIGGDKPATFGKTGSGKITKAKTYATIAGDDTTDTAREFYNSCIALEYKNYILWGGNYFTDFLDPKPCWIVWDKRDGMTSNNFADGEMAWTSFGSPLRIYRHVWNGMTRAGSRVDELSTRVHPTQKPVGIHVDILNDFSKESENILDGFCGSGSTLIACLKTKRNCYTCDIAETYVQIATKRACDFLVKNQIDYTIHLNGQPFDLKKFDE